MTDETKPTDPPPGSVSFWERISRLGIQAVVTVGFDAAWLVMIFLRIPYPEQFWWVVAAANGGLFGTGLIKQLRT